MHTQQPGAVAQARSARRWRHPFDSAGATVMLGVGLTVVLMLALRLLAR